MRSSGTVGTAMASTAYSGISAAMRRCRSFTSSLPLSSARGNRGPVVD